MRTMKTTCAKPRRGAAMIEMVVSLPLIFVIIALTFFFGTRMWRLQQAEAMARYEAWGMVHAGPSPKTYNYYNNSELNVAFMNNTAASVDTVRHDADDPYDAVTDFLDELYSYDTDMGDYTRQMVEQFPATVRVDFQTTHNAENELFSRMSGTLDRSHRRLAQPWWLYWPGRVMYENTGETPPILDGVANQTLLRDVFFQDFDDSMTTLANSDNDWAEAIRDFYLAWPGYRGPTVWDNSD